MVVAEVKAGDKRKPRRIVIGSGAVVVGKRLVGFSVGEVGPEEKKLKGA